MKVELQHLRAITAAYRTGRGTTLSGVGGAETGVNAPATPADQVTVSETASQVVTLRNALKIMPEISPARIEQLREQISNGTYQVASTELAECLSNLEVLDK